MPITRVELACPKCQEISTFPASVVDTVQQCPACGAYSDVELPEEVQPRSADDDYREESERQWKESARQLDVAGQHQEETAKQIEKAARLLAQAEDAIGQFCRFLERCERLAERTEQVLNKVESGGSV